MKQLLDGIAIFKNSEQKLLDDKLKERTEPF